ncbi:nuclear protein localization protein 4 [Coemansia spiralis]|nr:nuclear protein localization protein 4 [Coemansia spiralis]
MESTGWQTLALMLREASDSDLGGGSSDMATRGSDIPSATPSRPASTAPGAAAAGSPWACRHCTFENDAAADSCDMCALPRD